jgi:hypothetical protein
LTSTPYAHASSPISARFHEQTSVIVTINHLAFVERASVFGDAKKNTTLLD